MSVAIVEVSGYEVSTQDVLEAAALLLVTDALISVSTMIELK